MKKYFAFLLSGLLFMLQPAAAQTGKADSLLAQIDKTNDPEKLTTLMVQVHLLPDGNSILQKKGRQKLAAAKASGTEQEKEKALLLIAWAAGRLHNTPEMLDAGLQGIGISRNLKDYHYLERFLHETALAYNYQQDNHKANNYLLMEIQVATITSDIAVVFSGYSNLETAYSDLKMPDSALFYVKKELYLAGHTYLGRNRELLTEAYSDYGEALMANNQPDSALVYFRRSHQYAKYIVNSGDIFYLDGVMAQAFFQVGKPDSAAKYALESYSGMAPTNNYEERVKAAGVLAKVYDGRDDKKALFYLEAEMTASDSLNAVARSRQFQLISDQDKQHALDLQAAQERFSDRVRLYVVIGATVILLAIGVVLWRNNRKQKQTNLLLSEQKEEISAQRDELGHTIEQLKATQTQLIQSEKMASLGELTAGIAHEIQNPLNFVNNFSEINAELIDELQDEIDKGDYEEAKALAIDIKGNQQKINQHGRRADFIVKGMLEHSRTNTGEKQLTDINVLCDEFLKLSYHGLRAKDKSFNAEIIIHFDPNLPKVNVSQQDMGRVMLNLFNNAFYAVNQKAKKPPTGYKPEVTVSTSTENGQVTIKVKDNGVGIPDSIREKIMQPFFTTKPTGEGTGLGLSLTYDMVVKGHGGSIQVNSRENEGSEFIILLPLN